jgi:DmsE family decaheme c-type cytochrome
MMKFFRVMLALCAFGVALGGSNAVLAADDAKPVAKKEAAKDLVLRGDAKCTTCHDEMDSPKVLAIGATTHGVKADGRTPSCTDCHGASDAHIKEAGRGSKKGTGPDVVFAGKLSSPAQVSSNACLSCHEQERARTNWAGSQHAANDVACSNCHKVHAKQDAVRDKKTQAQVCFACHQQQRAEVRKVSTHPLDAGKVACSDCHNPHGSSGPKLLKKNTVNETCWTCHADKRGPFLFEHQPVSEDCSICHTPHGSNITPLLKSRAPLLCDECHDGPHASQTIVGRNAAGKQVGLTPTAPSSSYTGRACLNCHVQVHGSNSPAGGYQQR